MIAAGDGCLLSGVCSLDSTTKRLEREGMKIGNSALADSVMDEG